MLQPKFVKVKREIITTGDGSHSVSIPDMHVTYHSVHGAIQESMHVFIEAGLKNLPAQARLNIFEVGFGTGLNALLTIIAAEKLNTEIYYETVEQFPLDGSETRLLNYCKQLDRGDLESVFELLHDCEWEKKINVIENFSFKRSKTNLLNFETSQTFELIYYDAFAPNVQPELWTKEVFEKMIAMLRPGGILVTYCSKGDVRRAMQAAAFVVEKLPGPKGKREMIRGTR